MAVWPGLLAISPTWAEVEMFPRAEVGVILGGHCGEGCRGGLISAESVEDGAPGSSPHPAAAAGHPTPLLATGHYYFWYAL